MSWKAFSDFMWGVSGLCFSAYDRIQQAEARHAPSQPQPASRLPSFFRLVQQGAESLGLQAVQSENDPRYCFIAVPCMGRIYQLAVILLNGTDIELRAPCKVPMSRCPRGTAEWLERRSNDLPWGNWTQGDEFFMVASSVSVSDFLSNLQHAVTFLVGEAAALDTALINKGYA